MKIQKLLILILSLTAIFLTGCDIKLDSHAVDANKYLKADNTPAEVYEKSDKGQFYNPFNFGHTDFGRLILVSIDFIRISKYICNKAEFRFWQDI